MDYLEFLKDYKHLMSPTLSLIRAVAGQRSSPELSFANKTEMCFRAKK